MLERIFEDSGGIDVVEVDDEGVERRLTAARGDDQVGAPSPDGRYLVFTTARWNAASHYDLAILDHLIFAGTDCASMHRMGLL